MKISKNLENQLTELATQNGLSLEDYLQNFANMENIKLERAKSDTPFLSAKDRVKSIVMKVLSGESNTITFAEFFGYEPTHKRFTSKNPEQKNDVQSALVVSQSRS